MRNETSIPLTIRGAHFENGVLQLHVSPAEGIKAVHAITNGKKYDLKPHLENRSMDANAYAWALIHKIAQAIHDPPLVVYRRYVRDVGCRVSVITLPVEDVELETATFLSGHIGRMVSVEECKDARLPNHVTMIKKYGSSNYTTAQMAAFIDQIVQDCHALGIDTKDPADIQSLLDSWRG